MRRELELLKEMVVVCASSKKTNKPKNDLATEIGLNFEKNC